VEELVYTSTDDDLLLEGVVVRPRELAPRSVGFVWIHGNAARFYDYTYVLTSRALATLGFISLSGNTRGHDIAAAVWRAEAGRPRAWRGPQDMPIGAGSGWESLEESPRDLAAWVDLAASLSTDGIILVGHSSGAQRVVLYQAERHDPRVRGLALVSPDLQSFMMPGELEAATQMVAEGRGLEVVPAQPFAPFYRQSAASVVSRGAVVRRLRETSLAAIACPTIGIVGGCEPYGEQTLASLRAQLVSVPSLETRTIADADHVYTACERQLAEVLGRWAAEVLP
jgi:pimeloyl-ACP methyl ester carboxylesterase